MCCLVPVSYLSLACLCPGYRPACQSQGRRLDSGSGRGLTGPIRRWGRGAAPARGSLGTWPDWELARRGMVGNRHAGFGHALRKTQIRWALSKGHAGLTTMAVDPRQSRRRRGQSLEKRRLSPPLLGLGCWTGEGCNRRPLWKCLPLSVLRLILSAVRA